MIDGLDVGAQWALVRSLTTVLLRFPPFHDEIESRLRDGRATRALPNFQGWRLFIGKVCPSGASDGLRPHETI